MKGWLRRNGRQHCYKVYRHGGYISLCGMAWVSDTREPWAEACFHQSPDEDEHTCKTCTRIWQKAIDNPSA